MQELLSDLPCKNKANFSKIGSRRGPGVSLWCVSCPQTAVHRAARREVCLRIAHSLTEVSSNLETVRLQHAMLVGGAGHNSDFV
jgi:hypothetical protein